MSATRRESLESVFATDGPLARALPGFEARAGQVQMSQLIERGFLEGAHTLVEAGTGVGKSLAYLAPALRSGKKIVISTATIALQEQLVRKDIPLVVRALGIPARVELLKGRNQYLCRSKLERMRADRLIAQSATMEAMWAWSARTETGDRAELPFAPPGHEWELLDADADDCVGELCDRYRDCHFFARRDAAKYADIVVVNHALFFLDLALGGSLLPPYDYAVLDEAHQCEQWAAAALTATLSPGTVGRTMRRLHRQYQVPASYDAELDEGMRRPRTSPQARRSTGCNRRSTGSKTGSTPTGRRPSNGRRTTLPRRSAGATTRCAASSRTRPRSNARTCRPKRRFRGSSASRAKAATRSTPRPSTSRTICARRFSSARRAWS
jgi:Rad3-related DNA helicase